MANNDDNYAERQPWPLLVRHFAKKVFLDDWLIKIFALVVTLALWVGVTGLSEPTRETISQIPLVLRTAENTVISNVPIESVNLEISGDRRRLSQITRSELRVVVNLVDVPTGEHIVLLRPDTVEIPDLPNGVKVERIEPAQIAVMLEPIVQKDVDVRIETRGDLPAGYEIYERSVDPPKVRVSGPESFVSSLTSVATEKIDIDGKTEAFTLTGVRLNLANANAKTTILDSTVSVTLRIGEIRMERIFFVPMNDESGRKATVSLYGPRSLLIAARADEMLVEVTQNENGLTPVLRFPERLAGRVEVRQIKLP